MDVLADIRLHRRLREIRLRGQYEQNQERGERFTPNDELAAIKRLIARGLPSQPAHQDTRQDVTVRRRQAGANEGSPVSAGHRPSAQMPSGPNAALPSPGTWE
jgi:hypothetical protein